MEYTWLLLDADGTLFDYEKAEAAALRTTFEQNLDGFEPYYLRAYQEINAQIWLDYERGKLSQEQVKVRRFEQLFQALDIETDAALFSRRYLVNLGQAADLIKGAEGIIRALSKHVDLALITNGLKDVQRSRLARAGIGDVFEAVIISEEVGAAKPHPRIFDVAFQRMSHPPKEEVLIVGDSLSSDVKGGSDYGIDTCWYNPTGRTPDLDVTITYEICDLRQLREIVGIND